ncbi:MAG TPA: amidohydrolase family protein [Bryobacteraceae bacterium]|nr:amidohydrolase family protein [Bryobacteraceae bacterium]
MRPVLIMLAAVSTLCAESGRFTIHMILHAIGEERYEVTSSGEGLQLDSTLELTDRSNTRTTVTVMRLKSDYTPTSLQLAGHSTSDSVTVDTGQVVVNESWASRTFAAPEQYFTVFGPAPFAVQSILMRYWKAHAKPAKLPMLRARDAAPIEIGPAGRDSIVVNGKSIELERYTIANLMFGREIVWTNAQGDLAAAMTFAGGLPMEAVRAEYEPGLEQLYRGGVKQEMADLAAISREVPPKLSGTFAIVGAMLVDATGAAPVKDSVVIVRDGRIAAAGPRSKVQVPPHIATVDAKGQTLLPGLWEMHTHFSGVEFGPALLAAGITTARDCGGEFEYLVAQRDAAERGALSPRLLLAGLVDAGGLKAFGHVTAETPEQGRAVVDRYHAARFEQIKLYTYLQPDAIRAIAAEAHRLGMSVTGHVPEVFNAMQGVEAGMDQINHLFYASDMMRPAESAPVEVNSEQSKKVIAFLKEHGTVVDPTAGWSEMAGHAKDMDVASFEPGILNAPFVLEAKFRAMNGGGRSNNRAQNLAVIGALHRAGIPIVAGSDTGLVGYGLDREIELYVQAGMTPLEAIQAATIVPARAMKLDADSGSIEVGKRADMILVDGNPLENISDIRRVSRVVANGRLYEAGKLWESVGFRPTRNN